MKAATDEKNLCDLNGPTQTIREDFADVATVGSRPNPRNLSTRRRSQPLSGSNTCQTPLGNSVEISKSKPEYPGSTERTTCTTSNENTTCNNKESAIQRRIDAEDEPPLMPPNRTHPTTRQLIDTSEEWRDEDRAEIPSSSASTTSSFLQAAAIPPMLRSQETAPGAVCVPGLAGFFDDDQHDNLFDMGGENDEDNTNTNNYSTSTNSRLTSSRRSGATTIQSPQSTSFTFYSQSTSMSTPIVAELAPSYAYSEQEVEDRLAERLEVQMEAQIMERLQQEVDRRFSQNQKQHAIAEVIGSSHDIDYISSKGEKQEDENFKICGIRRTCWGMILCIIMLLTIAGVGGTYLWFSRASEIATNNTDNLPTTDDAASPSIQRTAPTISPMLSSPSTANTPTEIPSLLVNLSAIPTPTPPESNMPSMLSPTPSLTDRRREYLITSMVPFVVPNGFEDLPHTYFANDTYTFQYAALDWMATIDLQTDIFGTPVQLLVERYVLAVLYHSTGGARMWSESLSFLSSRNVCDWNNNHGIQKAIFSNAATTEDKFNVTEEPLDYSVVKKGVFCKNGSLFATSIQIPNNSLEGNIPWELSLLEYLTQIDFDTNTLYGPIPIELSRLSKLQALWFKSNNLTGRLPIEFSNATKLASIDLEDNSITSILPSEWGSLSNLFYVSLRLNDISGILPSDWRRLNQLKTLDLEGNQLQGTIPEEYGELTELVSLYFESNRLEGVLPSTFGNLTNLVNLFVDDNLFSGTVPIEYSALVNLEYFWFHRNLLTGSVDGTFCDSFLRPNDTNLKSNCLGNDLAEFPAQIECSCCTTCCDRNGTHCTDSLLQ